MDSRYWKYKNRFCYNRWKRFKRGVLFPWKQLQSMQEVQVWNGNSYLMPAEEKYWRKVWVDVIGLKDSISTVKFDGRSEQQILDIENHTQAIKILLDDLIRFDIIRITMRLQVLATVLLAGEEYFKESTSCQRMF